MHSRTYVAGGALAAVGLVLIVLAVAGVFSAGASTAGQVKVVTTASAPPPTPNSQKYPFGAPSGKPDYTVPPLPASRRSCRRSAPRRPSGSTEPIRSRRRFRSPNTSGPLVRPENAANENNNDPDRPWGVTLLTPDDPLTAISAVPLLHFPDDAPILYVTRQGIPKVTENELKRLGDTGISRYHYVDAFQVGAAANPAVERDLKTMGAKYATVTAPNVPALANTVDKLYGQIENPDTGVPNMRLGNNPRRSASGWWCGSLVPVYRARR